MALTNKEKMARRRARIREDPDLEASVREKDRIRRAKSRKEAKEKMTEAELKLYRVSENARIRKYRMDKSKPRAARGPYSLPYKSPQAMGKAVKRLKSSLPASPGKRSAVVAAVAKECGLQVAQSKRKPGPQGLTAEEKAAIASFYENDVISWQAPGRKDQVIIREKDEQGRPKKTVLQARYMLMSLSEAFQLFRQESPEINVGLSNFCEIRPKHIKLYDSIPHNVCVCAYHENMRMLLAGLRNEEGFCDNLTEFTESLVCSINSKACMTQECPECRGKFDALKPSNAQNEIKYQQWNKNEKVEMCGSAVDIFNEMKNQIRTFLVHVFVKRQQAFKMESLKNETDGTKILLQVDFSENASLPDQGEIQSAHWSHKQATLFTAYAWIKNDTNESIVIVSDDLNHTKLSVHAYITLILQYLTDKYADIKEVDVFSDGASSQFKQRFLFSNLYNWERDFNIKMRWHFFATSHGKGVVDGLGGTVKRSVWRYVRSGRGRAASPQEFCKVATDRNPQVQVVFLSSEKIQDKRDQLEAYWERTTAVPNTHKLHFVKSSGPSHIIVADTSLSDHHNEVRIIGLDDDDSTIDDVQPSDDEPDEELAVDQDIYKVGDWVVVKYEEQEYPGEVMSVNASNVQVNVMYRSGKNWRWPKTPDNIFYHQSNIVRKIDMPIVVGRRGQFAFVDI